MATMMVEISAEIEQRLDVLTKKTGRTKEQLLSESMEAIQERLDDLEDIIEAEEILERVKRGAEKIIPWEEVKRKHGLED